MKYSVVVGSGAVIFTPSFIKTGSDIRNLIGGIYNRTNRQLGDLINILLFLA
jgi:hypothetical protein